MKHLLFILCLAGCMETLAQDTTSYTISSTLPASCPSDSLKNTPVFFDEALAWVDTIECYTDTFILELPDSIYKQRLQSLPFVIEVPYNEVVKKYIHRYIRSPKQLASLQRKAEYLKIF